MLTICANKAYFECGVAVASGISYGSGAAISSIQSMIKGGKYAFFVMADAQIKDPQGTPAMTLKAYIEKENLGPMIESEGWHYNEAHGPRYIKIYVWRPDWEGDDFKAWVEKNIKVEDKNKGNMLKL